MSSIILLVALFGIMYLLMIRPQRKRAAERAAMLRAADIGDVVATVGGVIGTIVAVEEPGEVVCIEVDTDVELRVQRRAIGEIIAPVGGEGGGDPAPSDGADAPE